MVLAHALILLAHVRDLAQIERDAHGIERRTPELAVSIAAPDHEQRLGLLGRRARAQVADIGGGRSALDEAQLMISEKLSAAVETLGSIMLGRTPISIIERYRELVAENALRLSM